MFRRRYKDRRPRQTTKKVKGSRKLPRTKTLYLNENFHILCSQNEVIIGDSQNRVNSLFSFDYSSKKKIKKVATLSKEKKKNIQTKNEIQLRCNSDYSSRSSVSSERSNGSSKVKRKVKRKNQSLSKYYHINITKLQNTRSLDDQTGEFYTCECRVKSKRSKLVKRADLRIITSDTESCSDTGKTMFHAVADTRLFCTKCGNGYKTKNDLTEHMYIHETFCRLCNTSFMTEYMFREHMRLHIFKVYLCHICNAEFSFKNLFYKHFESHIEERTLETVLDMEEDYKILQCNLLNMNYNTSINSILCFLNEYPDINYYASRFFKIKCDLCRNEVMRCDYEKHLEIVHSNFHY